MMVRAVAESVTPAASPAARAPRGRVADAQSFVRMMRSAGLDASDLTGGGLDASAEDPRLVAAQLVSTLFYAPLLSEMRKFSIGEKFAFGGRTEEIFGEQLDRHIADAVAAADRGGLTDLLARQISGGDLNREDRRGGAARKEVANAP